MKLTKENIESKTAKGTFCIFGIHTEAEVAINIKGSHSTEKSVEILTQYLDWLSSDDSKEFFLDYMDGLLMPEEELSEEWFENVTIKIDSNFHHNKLGIDEKGNPCIDFELFCEDPESGDELEIFIALGGKEGKEVHQWDVNH